MVLKQREQIKDARIFFRNWVFQHFAGDLEEKETMYNRLMKAYLKGYHEALLNAKESIDQAV